MRCLRIKKLFPAIRKLLAIYLYEKGLTQSEIAELLEVSQPAISNYLRGKRGETKNAELDEKIIQEMADYMFKTRAKFSEVICKYCSKLVKE